MAGKRSRQRVATNRGPAAHPRVKNQPYRRTGHSSRWLLAAGGAVAVLAVGWWALQGWSNVPRQPSGNAAADGMISIGAQAPNIALPSTAGGQLSLDQYRGSRVVVYFYEGVG